MLPVWKESPFIRILLPFLIGITCYLLFPSSIISRPAIGTVAILSAILSFNFIKDFYKLKYAFIKGVLINLFIVFLAYLICVLHHHSSSGRWYKNQSENYSFAIVKINATPELKEKTLKAEVEIVQLRDSNKCVNTLGNAIVYFQKSEKNNTIRQGDFILIKNKFKDISKSGNPGSFDYAKYCASKNIFQSAYLKENEWEKTSEHAENYTSFFARINEYTRSIIKKHIPDSNAHGVAEALLLGYRSDIDDETWQAYSNTGIVHIIAISGMHMAMVYGSIRWVLLLIPFFKKEKIWQYSLQ